ncbi:MAG: hypothetical protein PHG05_02370 [Candidatus Nanoarchaeia archaeon]|nr:hypothetical protein [Candidatus Nanoarchaeia archaeon]
MTQDTKYVRIPSPVNSRKTLLGGAIDIIQFLKDYEKLLQIRKEKAVYINQCKRNFIDLKKEFLELNKLPKIDIAELEKHEQHVDIKQVIDIKKLKKKAESFKDKDILKEPKKNQKTSDKLQSDLDLLKAKLASL